MKYMNKKIISCSKCDCKDWVISQMNYHGQIDEVSGSNISFKKCTICGYIGPFVIKDERKKFN